MPWRGPNVPGELPTLGPIALKWMCEYLIVPDGAAAGEPFIPTLEQAQFTMDFYTVDPNFTGPVRQGNLMRNARRVRRAILSRPKGWGKALSSRVSVYWKLSGM